MRLWLYVLAGIGSLLIGLGTWFRHRARVREADALDDLLAMNRVALEAKRSGQVLDESMQARSQARREIAESLRQRSALIASGSKSGALLKMVKKA